MNRLAEIMQGYTLHKDNILDLYASSSFTKYDVRCTFEHNGTTLDVYHHQIRLRDTTHNTSTTIGFTMDMPVITHCPMAISRDQTTITIGYDDIDSEAVIFQKSTVEDMEWFDANAIKQMMELHKIIHPKLIEWQAEVLKNDKHNKCQFEGNAAHS